MKALVLGGGKPQEYLINELKNRGVVTLLADQNEKASAVKSADKFFLISALDVDRVKDVARRERVDFVISVCADQMLLVAAQVCEELGLPCYIDYETAKNVSNKKYMKQIFVENDISTTKHIVLAEFNDDDIEGMHYPLVVKPVDAYSSRGVRKVQNIDDLKKAFNNAISISRAGMAVIEEFADGEELSVDIYVDNGIVHILCIRVIEKIPDLDDFIICRGIYPAQLSEEMLHSIQNVAQQIADSFGLVNTPMLIQMKIDNDKINIIEFCARTGGGIKYHLIPEVSGFDPVKAVIDLTMGKKPHFTKYKYEGHIIDEFLYCKKGIFEHLEGFEELLEEGIIDCYEQFKPSGHNFTTISSSGDRIAYFSVKSDCHSEIERKHKIAGDRIKALSTSGEDLIRHDIIRLMHYGGLK